MGRGRRTEPQPPIVFFLDENTLGSRIAARLQGHPGTEIRHLGQDIPRGTPDHEWLPEIGSRGWFLITKDIRLRHRPVEAEARRRAELGVFVVRAKDLTGEEIGDVLKAALPRMTRAARKQTRPFVYHVNRKGEIKLHEGKGRQGGQRRGPKTKS